MGTRTRKMSLQRKILINLVILFTVLTAAYVLISYLEFKEYTVQDSPTGWRLVSVRWPANCMMRSSLPESPEVSRS